MPVWNPDQYLKFADHRLRPSQDLLARVDLAEAKLVCDVGCGPGNVTPLLRARFPQARLVGIDSSAEMLEKARAAHPGDDWILADAAHWVPDSPPDLLFANASLQWLGDHATLFPRLFGLLAPGGTLAVQMPRNFQAPSHQGMLEAALGGPWREVLAPLLRRDPVADPAFYWDILTPQAAHLDIWEVEYLQALRGPDAVVQWTKGTALKPLLDALDEPWREQFLAYYTARMAQAYPQRADGVTLFPFRRLFIVARKA